MVKQNNVDKTALGHILHHSQEGQRNRVHKRKIKVFIGQYF